MRQRCNNPNSKAFRYYGQRGIKVCERWDSDFWAFAEDMGERPKGCELDRINNDAGYSPENCRWVPHKKNMQNRRNTVRVTIEGREHLLSELVEKSGMKPDTIKARAGKGMTYAEVMDAETRYVFREGLALGATVGVAARLARTHCRRSHEWNEENTGTGPRGTRRCKACRRDREEKRKAERGA